MNKQIIKELREAFEQQYSLGTFDPTVAINILCRILDKSEEKREICFHCINGKCDCDCHQKEIFAARLPEKLKPYIHKPGEELVPYLDRDDIMINQLIDYLAHKE